MKPVSTLLAALLIIILSTGGCKRDVPVAAGTTTPYPALAEQRAQLAAKPHVPPTRLLDSNQLMTDLRFLASDSCAGRKPGTAGHARAAERILLRMRTAGVDSFDNSLLQPFSVPDTILQGKNIVGWVKGTAFPEKYLVISAHYDHLGVSANGATYYGADDNASGVACLLALAAYFKNNPHPYSLIFAALDQEEAGLVGAFRFVQRLEQKNRLPAVRLNLNMDMIARSDRNEIFASGIRHTPALRQAIDTVQAKTNVTVLMGHDGDPAESDWTAQSDHYAFHTRAVPFIYIGVEDHADYHQPTDTLDKINYSRYLENCNMILLLVQVLKP